MTDQPPALPPSIGADLEEASACCTFGAYRAAALLGRRAVEQVAVLRRVPRDRTTLSAKVAWLLQDGHLPAACAGDARTVVAVGGAAAHGGAPVTHEEAEAMVRAARAVANAVLGGHG